MGDPASGTYPRGARIVVVLAIVGAVTLWLTPDRVAGAPTLTIEPITWDVIGLDSNNPATGPDTFPVGGRICNAGPGAATGVTARFTWDSDNSYLALEHEPLIALGSIAAAACQDVYFNVVIERTADAFESARTYHLDALVDGEVVASTPQPRQLYVERLVSQNRNHVDAITGPGGSAPHTDLEVGDTVTYELHGGTATNGYEQLEVYLNFPNAVFRVLSVDAVYTGPAGGINDSVYADACGWEADPNSPDYLSCIGPMAWEGKAGGDVVLAYRLVVVGAGSGSVFGLIHDFSGSSYHYNADFGRDPLTFVSRLGETTTTVQPTETTEPNEVASTMLQTTIPLTAESSIPSPTVDPSWRLPETGSSTTSAAIAALAAALVAAGILVRRTATRPEPSVD